MRPRLAGFRRAVHVRLREHCSGGGEQRCPESDAGALPVIPSGSSSY
jgi:hypothetical protein